MFFNAIDPLRSARRLGPVLFQLPPNFKADVALLAAFVEKLPAEISCAFEFRNPSWLMDEVYRLLEKHRVALCLAESDKFEVPQVITAGFVYVSLAQSRLFARGSRRDSFAGGQAARRGSRRVRFFQA